MNVHTNNIQIIHDRNGAPAFVVLPYADWLASRDRQENLVPNEVVNLTFDHDWSPMRAWREHLGLTQAEIAARANMTQGAYAQMENSTRPRRASLKKISLAMGLTVEQLDF
ncbi:helix-turn-helix transcriptional regulator [Desulfopila sp. IMCC35006]|uniref:helix-turn-helix domain-containing protein n=1 Tax=Desulfopila sp. IMCC35006 TaxID=2569542 RepID=UPI0010ACE761|nr:helix-turn-helix transcriptional regulator [Desulfopila sp. IMCC35006]TKB25021.1 helix-turn-helix transcriptional regulator [Desulfopila sp. IMCC35006]